MIQSLSRRRRKETLIHSREKVGLVTSTLIGRFMKSVLPLCACTSTMRQFWVGTRSTVSGISRIKSSDAVERVPTVWFMENFHEFTIADRGHEPAGPVGRASPLRAVCPLPSRGAHGVTRPTFRFMENLHAKFGAHWAYEPAVRTIAMKQLGRDAFHRVRFVEPEIADAVERVPTDRMEPDADRRNEARVLPCP